MPDPGRRQPLWAQVLGDLRKRLLSGEFADRFPADRELTERYGVSRHTVREAVRHLQAEGVVDRARGKGSFVRPVIEQSLGTLYSLFRSVEEQGFVQRSRVRRLEARTDAVAAGMLGLAPDEPLVYLERLRLADDAPIVLDCSWLPASLTKDLLRVDFTHTGLYHELHERYNLGPTRGWERLMPALATPAQCRLLRLGPLDPVLSIERLAFVGDTPLEWRHGVIRTDRFTFVARWSAGEVGAAFEAAASEPSPAGSAQAL